MQAKFPGADITQFPNFSPTTQALGFTDSRPDLFVGQPPSTLDQVFASAPRLVEGAVAAPESITGQLAGRTTPALELFGGGTGVGSDNAVGGGTAPGGPAVSSGAVTGAAPSASTSTGSGLGPGAAGVVGGLANAAAAGVLSGISPIAGLGLAAFPAGIFSLGLPSTPAYAANPLGPMMAEARNNADLSPTGEVAAAPPGSFSAPGEASYGVPGEAENSSSNTSSSPSGGATGGLGAGSQGSPGAASGGTPGGSENSSSDTSSSPSGGGAGGSDGGDGTVICTELHRQGRVPDVLYRADQEFGAWLQRESPEILRGYHRWAKPVVRAMRRSRVLSAVIAPLAMPIIREIADWQTSARHSPWRASYVVLVLGLTLCRRLGRAPRALVVR